MLLAPIIAFLTVQFKTGQNSKDISDIEDRVDGHDHNLKELEKREAANDARRDQMYVMQEETRQDVKKVLVSITELATKMASNKELN